MTMASGVYGITLEDMIDNDHAVDWTADSNVVQLNTDTMTPDFNAWDFEADLTNEVSGTGYSAPGNAVDSPTSTATAGVLTMDAADEAWTTATFANAEGATIFDDTIANDPLWVTSDFGAAYSVTAGTFTIQWNASGIWTIDYIP
jgi:hypothetical protein